MSKNCVVRGLGLYALSALLACGSILLVSTARANTAPDGGAATTARKGEQIDLPPVTVSPERLTESEFVAPAAVRVVEGHEIERKTPAVVTDLLRGETGVFVQQTAVGQGAPIIRGLLGSEILMLVDGTRMNNAFFRPAPNQYFALVDPYNVDRVEILRGAASTLFGGDAMGGVINIITPTPHFTETEFRLRSRILGQFSSADRSWVSRLAMETGRSGLGLSAGITYQSHDDLSGGRDMSVQRPSKFYVFATDGKLALESGAHAVTILAQYSKQPKTPRYDELVAGYGSKPEYSVFFFEPNDRFFLQTRYTLTKPTSFLDQLVLTLSLQEMNDNRRLVEYGSSWELREENRSQLIDASLKLTSRLGKLMTFTYGVEGYLDRVKSGTVGTDMTTGAVERKSARFADGSTVKAFGLYLQDEVRGHERFTATLGGRFSAFEVDIPVADRGIGSTLNVQDLTGNLALAITVTPELKVVSNVGRGFRVPNVFDFSTLGPRSGNRYNMPNQNLGPEQVWSVDLGVKTSTSRFSGEAFGFYSGYTDKIESVETGELTADGRKVVKSMNINKMTLVGAEAGARVEVTKDLDVSASLIYTWGEETLPTGKVTPASRIPPLSGQVGLYYRPSAKLFLEAWARLAAAQRRLSDRDLGDSRINPAGTPAWATANLRLGWTPHPKFSTRLTVENIWDADYREHGSGMNAPGINVTLAVEAKL